MRRNCPNPTTCIGESWRDSLALWDNVAGWANFGGFFQAALMSRKGIRDFSGTGAVMGARFGSYSATHRLSASTIFAGPAQREGLRASSIISTCSAVAVGSCQTRILSWEV